MTEMKEVEIMLLSFVYVALLLDRRGFPENIFFSIIFFSISSCRNFLLINHSRNLPSHDFCMHGAYVIFLIDF